MKSSKHSSRFDIVTIFRKAAERASARASQIANSRKKYEIDFNSLDHLKTGWFVSLSLLDVILANGERPSVLWVQDFKTSRLLPTGTPLPSRGGLVGELDRLLLSFPKPDHIELEHRLGLASEAAAIQSWARNHQIPVTFASANVTEKRSR